MELGILLSGTGLPVDSWEQGFELARDMGYTYVELAGNGVEIAGDKPDLGRCDLDEAKRLVERASSSDLGVSAVQSHQCYPLNDEPGLAESVAHTKRMIDLASAGGIPLVHTTTGMRPGDMGEGTMWRMLKEVYDELLDHGAGAGVKVAVEPVFAYMVGSLATWRRFLEIIGRDDLYLNYDPSHFPYHDESPIPIIEEFGGCIVHAHAKDAMVAPDPEGTERDTVFEMPGGRKFEFVPPGQGQIDQVAVAKALKDAGFEGVVSLELGHGIPDPEQAARDNVGFMQSVLSQVCQQ